jgi:hypothetical protein
MKIKQLWDTALMKTSKKISLVLAVTSAIVWTIGVQSGFFRTLDTGVVEVVASLSPCLASA